MADKQSLIRNVVEWSKEQCRLMEAHLDQMNKGAKVYSFQGNKQIDDTDKWKEEYKRRISSLKELIKNYPEIE